MRILLTGGGTGGHIYPALAIARGLKERLPEAELLYVGSCNGLEVELIPREGIPLATIDVRGLLGKSPGRKVSGVARAALACIQSLRILRRFRPRVVVGTGGYVCGPVVLMAMAMHIPTALQEQNVFPGSTNRFLARWADLVFVPFQEASRYFPRGARLVVSGNPVRREILEVRREEGAHAVGLDPGRPIVLVFSGSRGARSINRAMLEVIESRGTRLPAQLLYITGREYYSWVKERLRDMGIDVEKAGNITIRPYLYNMEHALAAADLVVSRAGAMTLAEITARGLPAVLIPSPHVANNHQEYNARLLESKGAAVLISDREVSGERLVQAIASLLANPARLRDMAAASKEAGKPDALFTIIEGILSLMEK